jgi:hypothetical protein
LSSSPWPPLISVATRSAGAGNELALHSARCVCEVACTLLFPHCRMRFGVAFVQLSSRCKASLWYPELPLWRVCVFISCICLPFSLAFLLLPFISFYISLGPMPLFPTRFCSSLSYLSFISFFLIHFLRFIPSSLCTCLSSRLFSLSLSLSLSTLFLSSRLHLFST